ncbi:hypothetical protein CVS54_00189 [Microbacterium oxydans]|uniref:DUF11 domain-containing protein n=1 Tax=Microbacterium oxydans TaxID=82380 RepID=A0A3S9WFP5_9MICO|nr:MULTISPECIES: DUF11 domain-containing protein [Microbacterium]AZS38892.1 hypothetical protein CVS54_00189 [Microbacterium oxydans]
MWKRTGAFMLGMLLAMGTIAAVAAPATAATAASASIVGPKVGTFVLADGTVATATISAAGGRIFGGAGQTLGAWSGADAMYADGVSAKVLPALNIHSSQNCGSAKRCGEGQLTIEFDRPVDDPAIHIAEFGAGNGGVGNGWSAADGFRFASADGGATAAVVSAGATFTDGGEGYFRGDVKINCASADRPGGCGSFTVPGTKITRIVFDTARFALSPVQTAGLDGYAFAVTATATPETPDPLSALSVSKVVDRAAAVPGDELDYTITVRNTGAADARDVAVRDALPSGLTRVSADHEGRVEGSGVMWTIDTIPAGDRVQLHVTGTVDRSVGATTLENRVVAQNSGEAPVGTPAPTYSTPCTDDPAAACALTVVTALPALSLSKTVDKQVAGHGEALSYTLVVANSGSATAFDVPVIDQLPAQLDRVSADQGGVVADGAVRWTVPEIPAGGAVELRVTGEAPGGVEEARLVNRATVENPAGAPAGAPEPTILTPCPDDVRHACAMTLVSALASLEIDKTVKQRSAQAGAVLDYTITVTNRGPGAATQIPVVDDLPDGAKFVAASTGGIAVKDRVGWLVPEIPPGQSVTMTLRVQAPRSAKGEVTNRATVAYDQTMVDALRSSAKKAGIELPATAPDLPALPPLTAAHACEEGSDWSCAVTVIIEPAPAGLAQTGATFALAIPAFLLLGGGALLLLLGARRRSRT